MVRWFSFGLLLALVLVAGLLFYRVMAGFLLSMFLAVIQVIMFRPVHEWVLKKVKGRIRLAAALTTIIVVMVVLVPLAAVTSLAALEASSLLANLGDESIRERLGHLQGKLSLEYDYVDELRYLESSLVSLLDESQQGATAQGDPVAVHRLLSVTRQLAEKMREDGQTPQRIEALTRLQQALTSLQAISDDATQIGTLDYQQHLKASMESFRILKLNILGNEFHAWLKELAHPTQDDVRWLTNRVFAGAPGFLRSVGGATTNIALQTLLVVGVMIVSLYFFLADGPKMVSTLMELSPLDDRQERELLTEFDRISRSVVAATLLSAIAQGVLAGIGFRIAGVGSVFLLSMITILFALIPFVGAATVWVPVCIWLYAVDGRPFAAVVLAVYGLVIISMADNVIKPLVLHGQSNLHPLLALLSVLGGVQALGPIGILVGPMIVVLLQTLLNLLHREMETLDKDRGKKSPSHGV